MSCCYEARLLQEGTNIVVFLQFFQQVEAAKQAADLEQKEYDDLVQWLNEAEELLNIVDRPVHDRQKEYKVKNLFFSLH